MANTTQSAESFAASPLDVARRFLGTREVQGHLANARVLAMLQLCDAGVSDDVTPWCSAFVNYVAWLLGLPRSGSLAARSWLRVGVEIPIAEARPGFDVVVLNRGGPTNPALSGPGHVGFFVSLDEHEVTLLGGNQGDAVSVGRFARVNVLGVRRLWDNGESERRQFAGR